MTDAPDDRDSPAVSMAGKLPELEAPKGKLPPWPDELLVAAKKELALAFLRGLGLPSRVASRHLGSWARWTGAELTRADWSVIRRDVSPTPPE